MGAGQDSALGVRAPQSRNAPCPCGSGLRYKACHGQVTEPAGDPFTRRLGEAEAHLRQGAWDEAEAIARELLAQDADHPEALRIVAQVAYERGRPEAALPLLLRAARALATHALTPAAQYGIWTAVNYMFTQVLSGLDATQAATLRTQYGARPPHPARAVVAQPTFAVVLLAHGDPGAIRAAASSIAQQDRLPDEVVVVTREGVAFDESALEPLASTRLRCRRVQVPATATHPQALNAGVGAATADCIALLDAPNRYAPGRLAAIAEYVGRADAQWGFTGASYADGTGEPVSPEQNPVALRLRALLDGVSESDTVGYALMHQEFVGLGAGNLWFMRTLFDALGGFRDVPLADWDLCLRALWLCEPAFLPQPLYVHRVADAIDAAADAERGRAQVSIFADYYARACRDDVQPPNAYAPSLAVWGLHFLKTPFQVGHILAFGLDQLGRLAELIVERRRELVVGALTPGINFVGFAFGEFGLGESLRALAGACATADIPFVVKDVDMRLKSRQADRTIAGHVVDTIVHRASLYCLNPDMMKPVYSLLRTTREHGGYNIGYWYWELETLPASWEDALGRVDEIWVATEFVAAAMRRASPLPVVKIPPPIEVGLSRRYTRAEFGLPEDAFLFLFSFDFNSFLKRKNPEATIAAFRAAFPPQRRDVALVVKSINGNVERERLRAVMDVVGGDERILIKDGFLARDEVFGLESVVDAYVSLHRAEGLGLGLAESMYLGKPVIGTAYSGNLEFMHPGNSCLVGYRMIPIAPGEYLYDDARFQWADPSIDEAAAAMRRLVDDAAFRTRIAHAGQQTIRTQFTRERAATLMRERLSVLGMLR